MDGEAIRASTRLMGWALVGLLGLFDVPSGAAAQSPFEVGVGVARNGSPPVELSDDGCAADIGWAGEARGGLRLSRAARIEGVVGYNFEQTVRCPDPIAPPLSGEQTLQTSPAAGYPFWTTDIRLAFEPSSPAGTFWLRGFGGYGRMWGKDIGYWLAGGGVVFGGNLETVLDIEWNWFDVPFDRTVRVFQDGVVVSETASSGSISRSELRVKAGFRLRL